MTTLKASREVSTAASTALKDYYSCVTIEVQVFVRAKDGEQAEDLANSAMKSLQLSTSVDCELIDYEICTTEEINLYE